MRTRKLWLALLAAFTPLASFAQEGAAEVVASTTISLIPIGAGLGIAIAVVAAAMAQGRIASAYLEGVSRNPGAQKVMFTPLILGLAFVETLVLFTILIEMMVLGKLL